MMINNNLKAVSSTDDELIVENYIILFGGDDLSGEHFTKSTSIESNFTKTGMLYVDFEHGYDPDGVGNSKDNILGYVDWSTAKADSTGVFVRRVLNRRAEYVKYLEKLIDAGLLGTSSEAMRGGISKKTSGEIIDWPLVRDSLTVSPMEPRMMGENILSSIKSLSEYFPKSKSLSFLSEKENNDEEKFKSIDKIQDIRDVETYLRDAGMSKQNARTLISRVKSLARSDADADELAPLAEALKNLKSPI